ncbi:MAG: hypothetical protein WC718_00250 [Phycisphaerales bacterium]|jgi:hypothetical protein
MSVTPDADQTLRRLITESGRKLKAIVRDAGLEDCRYHAVWRWHKGKQPGIDLATAAALHVAITGRPIMAVGDQH